MAYLLPGVAPREEGGPAGGTENSRSQVAVAVGIVYSVQYLPPGVAPREKGGPAGGARAEEGGHGASAAATRTRLCARFWLFRLLICEKSRTYCEMSIFFSIYNV